jgi:sulfate adenylyltransferase
MERLVSPVEATVWRKQKALKGLWPLTIRQLCDLELIVNGGFSPLKGFMARTDYDGVVSRMRLKDGTLWPIPITLDVADAFADRLTICGSRIFTGKRSKFIKRRTWVTAVLLDC